MSGEKELCFQIMQELADKYYFESHLYFPTNESKNKRKFAGAMDSYAKLVEGEYWMLCLDDTLFGDASDGFLLTNRGIHIHNTSEDYVFIPYTSMGDVSFDSGKLTSNICFSHSKSKVICSALSAKTLKAICDIITYCKQQFTNHPSVEKRYQNNSNYSDKKEADDTPDWVAKTKANIEYLDDKEDIKEYIVLCRRFNENRLEQRELETLKKWSKYIELIKSYREGSIGDAWLKAMGSAKYLTTEEEITEYVTLMSQLVENTLDVEGITRLNILREHIKFAKGVREIANSFALS